MIEKILERLEISYHVNFNFHIRDDYRKIIDEIYDEVFKIVQEVAKDGGWIPCSERLPEHMQRCLTTARIYFVPDHVDEPDNYIGVELNTYSKNFGWLNNTEVIAWQPLPAPYQKGE